MLAAPDVALSVTLCVALSLPAGWFVGVLVDRIPGREPLWRPWPPIVFDAWHGAIHVGTTAAFAAAGWRFAGDPWGFLAGALVLFGALVALAVIDIQVQRLPDRIVGPLYVAVLGIIVATSIAVEEPARIRWAIIGGAVWVLVLGAGWLIGMGFGDVKAGGVMGMYLGWLAPSADQAVVLALYGLMFGVLVAAVYGVIDRIVISIRIPRSERRHRPKRWFALGPFLVGGAIVTVLIYPSLIRGVAG